jgi:hypothetical protein
LVSCRELAEALDSDARCFRLEAEEDAGSLEGIESRADDLGGSVAILVIPEEGEFGARIEVGRRSIDAPSELAAAILLMEDEDDDDDEGIPEPFFTPDARMPMLLAFVRPPAARGSDEELPSL